MYETSQEVQVRLTVSDLIGGCETAIAKAEGDQASAYRIAILESRLSPTELTQAELLAAAWLRIHHKEPALNEHAPARRQRYAVETKR
jgi:hypothetical protein